MSWGPTLENAYFNTEIIDAYCRILILAKQLGRVNYFSEQHTAELMEFKKRIGYDDPRVHIKDCELCGPSVFDEGYDDFVPEPYAFRRDAQEPTIHTGGGACECPTPAHASNGRAQSNGKAQPSAPDMETLVRLVTDRVMEALAGAGA